MPKASELKSGMVVEIDGKPVEIEPMTLIALTKFVGVE